MITPDLAGSATAPSIPVIADLDREPDHGLISFGDSSVAHDILLLRATVAQRLLGQGSSVTVDLSDLRHPSSGAVGTLLWARRRCHARGIPFSVLGATGITLQAMRRSGLVATDGFGLGAR